MNVVDGVAVRPIEIAQQITLEQYALVAMNGLLTGEGVTLESGPLARTAFTIAEAMVAEAARRAKK